ncbi:hypothetical protein KC364_g53 [Hortaea werneckii]|nr:hypothetical protein KC364_g53 [Hortaea werneckii]
MGGQGQKREIKFSSTTVGSAVRHRAARSHLPPTCPPKNQKAWTREHEVGRLRSEQGFAPACGCATWRIMVPVSKRVEIRAPARHARGVRASFVQPVLSSNSPTSHLLHSNIAARRNNGHRHIWYRIFILRHHKMPWLLLPERRGSDRDEVEQLVTEEEREGAERLLKAQDEKHTNTTDAAISGTFAVLRSYHFPAAAAALNTRGNGGAAGSTRNGAYDGSTEGSSESVYQSMYRSVFDRSRNGNAASSVLENVDAAIDSDGDDKSVKKKTVSASVFYMVLRHGHLMLYDSAAQLEVRHVISLAHHSISLSEGESLDGDGDEIMKDADLFIKRTAIVLSPTHVPNARQQEPGARPRPFFLFSSNSSEKEDFYHALLSTRNPPPVPQLLLPEEVIKLQSTLHSSSLTGETRAFNALVGRIFLGIHRTTFLETLIRTKIERKIARVQKPAFIASLDVKSISLGNAAPILSSPKLADINIAGDMTLAFDVRYSGGIRVVIAAVAKIDLGSRFKTRTVDLVLSTSLQRLSGHMLLRVKAPPSNRIWFCFETMPDMEIKVEPIVRPHSQCRWRDLGEAELG